MSITVQTSPPSFGRVLSDRVDAGLSEDVLKRAYRRLHRKALLVVAWYIGSYVWMLLAASWLAGSLACVSFALATVAVGFNIQHDANHNAFFRTHGRRRLSTPNRIAGFSLNVIGGSAKRWIEGHVIQHHAAPNVVGRDHDIELAPFARLAPSQRRRAWHGFQHVYLWGIYAFTSGSIIVSDVSSTIQESFVGDRHGKAPGLRDYASLAASKGVFILFMVVIPMLFHPWWIVVLGALLVLGVSGFLLGVVFQLAHVVEEADFCDATNRASGRWHEWQVRSSIGFCQGDGSVSRVLTWYAGGLNFQTEHHLFPSLPHTAYPHISAIVTDTCADFGIERRLQPTLRGAVRSHYRHVRRLGQPDRGPAVDEQVAA